MVTPATVRLAGVKSMHGSWTFATGTIHQTAIHVTESLIKAMHTGQLETRLYRAEGVRVSFANNSCWGQRFAAYRRIVLTRIDFSIIERRIAGHRVNRDRYAIFHDRSLPVIIVTSPISSVGRVFPIPR